MGDLGGSHAPDRHDPPRTGLFWESGARVFPDAEHWPLGSVPASATVCPSRLGPKCSCCGLLFLPTWTTFLERFSPVPIHGPAVHPQSPLGRTAHPVWEANACHLPGVPGCRDPGGPASSVPAPPGPALRLPALPWRPGPTEPAPRDSGRPAVGGASARGRGLCCPSRPPRYTAPRLVSPGGKGGKRRDDRV